MTIKRCLQWLALAIGIMLPVGPVLASSDLLFGEQHAYSVTLRGNGEAVVTARLVITNRADTPLTTFNFTIPKLNVNEIVGYQQTITPTACNSIKTLSLPAQPCLEMAPDYATSYYYGSQSTYDKLKLQASGQKYTVTLPKPVAASQQTALLISYTGKGYASNQLGRWEYAVPTLVVGERVSTATIAISTDSDLYLANATSKVNYAGNATATTSLAEGATAQPSAASLDRIAATVGNDGLIVKTARDLAAGDSYTVKGVYVDASWKLYYDRLAFLAGTVLLLVGAVLVWWWRSRRHGNSPQPAAKTGANPPTPTATTTPSARLALLVAFGGFVSAVLLTLVVYGAAWLGQVYATTANDPRLFIGVSLLLVTLALSLLLIVGPVAWVALSYHSWRAGLAMFASQVTWLVAIFMVLVFIVAPILGPDSNPIIQPMSSGTSSSSSQGSAATDLPAAANGQASGGSTASPSSAK